MSFSYLDAIAAAKLEWNPNPDPTKRESESPYTRVTQLRQHDATMPQDRARAVAVALDPNTTPDELRAQILRLAQAHLPGRTVEMALQRTLTPALAWHLHSLGDPAVALSLAQNPRTPAALLEQIARAVWDAPSGQPRETWLNALANPTLPATSAQEAFDTYIAIDDVFEAVIKHPGLRPEQLTAQIRSTTPATRLALVANHPALPTQAIERLGKEKRTSVLTALLSTESALPTVFLERLAVHPSPAVRTALLLQPCTAPLPESVQDLLVGSAPGARDLLTQEFPKKDPLQSSSALTRWRNERQDLARALMTSPRIDPARQAALLRRAIEHPQVTATPLVSGARVAAQVRPVHPDIQASMVERLRRLIATHREESEKTGKGLNVAWHHDMSGILADLLLTRPEAEPTHLREVAELLMTWWTLVRQDRTVPGYQRNYQSATLIAAVVRLGREPQPAEGPDAPPRVRAWVQDLLAHDDTRRALAEAVRRPEQRDLLRGTHQARMTDDKRVAAGKPSRLLQWSAEERQLPYARHWGLTPADLRPLLLDANQDVRVWATQMLGQLRSGPTPEGAREPAPPPTR